ncbi:MAG: 5'/3'-nucleotidase SurE [Anaerolineae bacterium]
MFKPTRPLILLTNDDGIRSPGLRAAAEAVCELGDLLMVAPAQQQTGMGRAIPPVPGRRIRQEVVSVGCQEMPAFALEVTPAQAVGYGILVLAPHFYGRRPDLVISGINYGENLGTSVTVSGTVGAALQAAEMGVRGLAVSLETDKAYHYNHGHDVDWSAAAHFTRWCAAALLSAQLPPDVDVIKIDVPYNATPGTPWRLTRQSRQSYYEVLPPAVPMLDGELPLLDYRVAIDWDTLEPDSDIWAFARDRVVSVTPLSQDMTARADFAGLGELLRGA